MRFVPGTNLREVIDRAPMALPRVARILTDVARALDVAHARGLVHRDVKPANILLSGDGENEQVYLTDFGLTKRLGSHGDLTRPGGWVGTPDYVAPEQIQAQTSTAAPTSTRSGCVLYEMLTGRVAYAKGSDMAKLWAHVSDPPPLPSTERPDLVKGFDAAVARATAKDPDDRYGTASELAAAVRAAVAEQELADRQSDTAQVAQLAGADERVSTSDEVFIDHPPRAGGNGESAVPLASAEQARNHPWIRSRTAGATGRWLPPPRCCSGPAPSSRPCSSPTGRRTAARRPRAWR